MRGLAALLMLSACRFGFDPHESLLDDAAVADATPDALPPTSLQIDIVIITRLDACVIGDNCTTGCVSIQNNANVDQFKFQPNPNFFVVPPGDPRIATATVSKCLTTIVDPVEVGKVHAEFDLLASRVSDATHGTLELDLRYHEVTSAGMGRFNQTPWIDQSAIPAAVLPQLGAASDLVFVINDMQDDALGLHMVTQYCGLNYGTDTSPKGYPYVWNPTGCVSYDNQRNYLLGEMHRAIHRITTFDDFYDDVYPPCGAQTVEPTRWFPDPNVCGTDPDDQYCGGVADCTGIAEDYHHHILDQHWTRDLTTTLNHCADGILDYGETSVDTGGSCL